MNKKSTLSMVLLSSILFSSLVGCVIGPVREAEPVGRVAPSWYKTAPVDSDDEFIYVTAYSEQGRSFQHALTMAEEKAQESIARLIGNEVIKKTINHYKDSRKDWADLTIGLSSFDEDQLSESLNETQKGEVETLINQTVRKARTKDLYVEKVTVGEYGFLFLSKTMYTRYDCGVLVEYPKAELERVDELLKQRDGENQAMMETIRKAERFWSAGKKSDAISVMRQAHREYPLSDEVAYRLGRYLEDAGLDAEAEKIFKNLVASGRTSEWVEKSRGHIMEDDLIAWENTRKVMERNGFKATDIMAIIKDITKTELERARIMARQAYRGDEQNHCYLWLWHISSVADLEKNQSQAARYDFNDSSKRVNDTMGEWTDARSAEPVIQLLLTMANTDVETRTAVDALSMIKQKTNLNGAFSEDLKNTAHDALFGSAVDGADEILEWLSTGS